MVKYLKGMKVLIAKDISKTERKIGLDSESIMRKLQGHIVTVDEVDPLNSSRVYIRDSNQSWCFDIDDLTEIKPIKLPSKPVTFDPKMLNI